MNANKSQMLNASVSHWASAAQAAHAAGDKAGVKRAWGNAIAIATRSEANGYLVRREGLSLYVVTKVGSRGAVYGRRVLLTSKTLHKVEKQLRTSVGFKAY